MEYWYWGGRERKQFPGAEAGNSIPQTLVSATEVV